MSTAYDPSYFTGYRSSGSGETEFRARDGRSFVLFGKDADELRGRIDARTKALESAGYANAHAQSQPPTVTDQIDALEPVTGRGGPLPPPSTATAAFARSTASAGLDAAMAPVTLTARGLRALGVEHPLVREASELSGARAIEDATWIATGEDPAPYRARVERERADFPTATAAGEELGGVVGGLGTGAVQGRLTKRFVRQAGPVLEARTKAERQAIASDAVELAKRLGVANMAFNRDPQSMRDMTGIRRAYEGTTPDVADQIATGQRPPQGSGSGQPLPPVDVHVYPSEGIVALNDGRHRLQAAQEAGAERIRARVRVYGPRGGLIEQREEILPIQGLTETTQAPRRDPAAQAEAAAEYLQAHPDYPEVYRATGNTYGLNQYLRKREQGALQYQDQRSEQRAQALSRALEGAIGAGHTHEGGPLLRGLQLPRQVLDDWLSKGTIRNATFWSTSSDPNYLSRGNWPHSEKEPGVFLRIRTRSGVPVSRVSAYPHESEVLIPPGRSWQIRNVARDERGRYVLDVDEVPELPANATPAISFTGTGALPVVAPQGTALLGYPAEERERAARGR